MLSEVSLELRIERDVAGVVQQQIELRLLCSRPGQVLGKQEAQIR
jgi:hypothetical protein